jgi:lysophospholipase L1-like esterase
MDRRRVAALIGTILLGGCGGGGGGAPSPDLTATPSSPSPSPSPSPAPSSAAGGSADIAVWGDSLTPPVAANLQMLEPGRTVFSGGVDGDTSTQIAARELNDPSRKTWVSVLWYGANNPDDPARIKADIAASVAGLAAAGNNRFLVLSVVNEATPQSSLGSAIYSDVVSLNQELAALYPANFFDIRAYLMAHYDPNRPQDVADVQNGDVPSSLRIDEIHLDNDGSLLVAAKIKELIDARGW